MPLETSTIIRKRRAAEKWRTIISKLAYSGGVAQSLCLPEAHHVGGRVTMGGDDAARGGNKAVVNDYFLHLLVKDLLHVRAQGLVLGLVLLKLLLFLLILGHLSPPGDGDESLAVVLNAFSCCITYSSMGSHMYPTS